MKKLPGRLSRQAFTGLLAGWLVLGTAAPASAGSLSINQVSWLSSLGGYLAQYSEWGTANFQIGPGDTSLFTPSGSGYFGYLQVATNANGGDGANNWAVQNKLMVFNSINDFQGRLPETMTFNLGVSRGMDLSGATGYRATIFVTSAPLASMPSIDLHGSQYAVSVGQDQWLFGGGAQDQGSPTYSGQAGQATPPLAVNYLGAAVADTKKSGQKIAVKDTDIAAVDEEVNGCGPAAKARSILYLKQLGLLKTNDAAQKIYDDLKSDTYMKTKLGAGLKRGTTEKNFIDGANKYSTDKKLGLKTEKSLTPGSVELALENKEDVEIHVYWGKNGTTDLGGHIAFVSEIVVYRDDRFNVTGYEVKIIDDPTQGDSKAENRSRWLKFDKDDNLAGFGTGAKLEHFYEEKASAAPEPGAAVMMVLGLASIGLFAGYKRLGKSEAK
jgi:hypothetical protein